MPGLDDIHSCSTDHQPASQKHKATPRCHGAFPLNISTKAHDLAKSDLQKIRLSTMHALLHVFMSLLDCMSTSSHSRRGTHDASVRLLITNLVSLRMTQEYPGGLQYGAIEQ
jgi:hypothetical protein